MNLGHYDKGHEPITRGQYCMIALTGDTLSNQTQKIARWLPGPEGMSCRGVPAYWVQSFSFVRQKEF